MPRRAPTHRPARASLGDGRASASARGYDAHWRKLRLIVLRARPVCEHCGREEARVVDHHISLATGGTNDLANLVSLCKRCHDQKTVAHDGGFGRARRPVERRAE